MCSLIEMKEASSIPVIVSSFNFLLIIREKSALLAMQLQMIMQDFSLLIAVE